MADIKPTRSELIKLKTKIKLAKSGYNLLKKKRDGLILEFFEILKEAKILRGALVDEYRKALDAMTIARCLDSDLKIKSMALAIKDSPKVELAKRNIMGVVSPKVKSEPVQKKLEERGYGILESSASIDAAADAYETVVEKAIRAAEVETAMKRLLAEIEKTKRRVNALEFEVIPKMEYVQGFIKLRLQEMERENVFRLKRIKA